MEWHGSSIYGIANALAFGEVLPSEVDGDGHGTACGRIPRGRLAVPCAMEPRTPFQGLPGASPSALPLATWQAVDRSRMSKSEKKRTPGFILDIEDDHLSRRKMRAGLGEQQEKDWTNSPHDTADQYSSSRGYVMGLMVGLMHPWNATKYL